MALPSKKSRGRQAGSTSSVSRDETSRKERNFLALPGDYGITRNPDADYEQHAGEHIDYCGFSVLPAAIERDVLIAFSTEPLTGDNKDESIPKPSKPGKTVIVLRNTEEKYSPTAFEVDLAGNGDDLALPEKHHWSSYFIAGTKGILAHLVKTRSRNISTPKPGPALIRILVDGTVPEGSGLSSSSAMTTASAIAILEISGRREGEFQVGRIDVTNVAIESGQCPACRS